MKPIPVAFHIGPLELHTYGIGLAITFWFAYRYFERRLKARGYATQWVGFLFLWVIVTAVAGARAMHVVANAGFYIHHPIQILEVWHGGLSSFGGLLLAVPTAIVITRRRCPELRTLKALDIIAPVLAASWAIGRLLGPQLMVAGGGHPTNQWFGMYYADQVGKRLPVPIFQAFEDAVIFVVLLLVERRLQHWPNGTRRSVYPPGTVLGVAMVLWGVERTLDQHLWLAEPGHLGSVLVQLAGVGLILGGLVVLITVRRRWTAHFAGGQPNLAGAGSEQVVPAVGGSNASGGGVSPGPGPGEGSSPGDEAGVGTSVARVEGDTAGADSAPGLRRPGLVTDL